MTERLSPVEEISRIERDSSLPAVDAVAAYLEGFLGTRKFNPLEVKVLGTTACDLLFTSSVSGGVISDADIRYLLEEPVID